ncbi:MAG: 30S ribosomal protein S18 [Planctomycetota bacterium]
MARKRRRYTRPGDKSRCRFCKLEIGQVDYKDADVLRKLLTGQGKIFSRRRSGNCAAHQRSAKKAIKRARTIGLLPYAGR